MISREFKVKLKEFRRKKLTLLQHKLRVVMKCYTVQDFNFNEDNNTFTFQKTYRKYGVKVVDPTINTGGIEIKETENSEDIILKVYVN